MRYTLPLLLIFSFVLQSQHSDFSTVDFAKADSVASMLKGESLKNLPVLTHKLTANLTTDVEKFRAIYTWVCTNIENDYGSYLKTRSKRKKFSKDREAFLEWNNSFTPKVFEKLVTEKKTACTGYAYLIKELASLADLNSKIIAGYGRTATLRLDKKSIPNHSWNAVELNNKWYLCDATWSAGRILIEDEGPIFESDYHDGYFLADPVLFIKNHYPLEINSALLSKPPSFDEFIEGPVVYKEAFTYPIIPLVPEKMHLEVLKNEPVHFDLNAQNAIQNKKFALVMNSGGNNKTIEPKITRDKNKITIQHTFTKTGLYDVHIQLEDTFVATYVVRVKRK
jgi:hypothetical protein